MAIKTLRDGELNDIRFAALSYVWGPKKSQRVLLRTENKDQLATEGALGRILIQQTVQDAISLTKSLDLQYLWVDALCIIQNDSEDQRSQISNMHWIYSNAFFTIAAASGNDSNAGLPGIRTGTRFYEQQEAVVLDPAEDDPGLTLITCIESNLKWVGSDIQLSPWNRRAWNMQETVLSRRLIIFSAEQVSWTCSCATFWEEAFFEIRDLRCKFGDQSTFYNLKLPCLNSADPPWCQYTPLVESFSKRNLTKLGDYSDAFTPVLNKITEMTGEEFLWALPCSKFGLALSWTAPDDLGNLSLVDPASSVTVGDLETHLPALTNEVLNSFPDEYLLFFWAYAVQYPFKTSQPAHPLFKPVVLTSRAAGMGVEISHDHTLSTVSSFEDSPKPGSFFFIAISKRPNYDPPQIIAMQIKLVGSVAYRMDVEEFDEEEWWRASPKKILVALR
ncbi:heterokaryon incompatibility protein-domain-containing protein [Phaeosphaeriaceae sp. PMI808]|nr:heterokaryon incompatibility protein-domain-containing protein [Phaeosphaeriaceae sp. PMI808]